MQILVIYIIMLIIPFISTFIINFGFGKYKETKNKRKLTGCEVAHEILDSASLDKVYVVANRSNINSYNSNRKVIKLSDDVFDEDTIYGIAIGALKAVEATLDKKSNTIMHFRDSIYETVNLAMVASYILLVLGLVSGIYEIMYIALGFNIINFIYNAVMFNNEKKTIEKTIKLLSKDGYIDKDEKEEVLYILNRSKFNYFADMINCLSRLVEIIIPKN